MNVPLSSVLSTLRTQARRHAVLRALAVAAPLGIALAALTALGIALPMTLLLGVLVLVTALALGWRDARRLDARWLARRLDASFREFDDSAALIVSPPDAPTPLQALQQARLERRLAATFATRGFPDFRAPLPWPAIARSAAVSLLVVLLVLAAQRGLFERGDAASIASGPAASAGAIELADARVSVTPPAYTGLSATTESSADIKAPLGSALAWSLRFSGEPRTAALRLSDGRVLPLTKQGERWTATDTLQQSALYRIAFDDVEPAAGVRAYRLDAVPDQAPEITVRLPEKTLTLLDAAPKEWPLDIEARDDYALGDAVLTITLAQGSGEQVKVTEQTRVLDGGSARRERRYRTTIDVAALGYAQGDDLIVRLSVSDNHVPEPNVASTASYILRWPQRRATDTAGLDGPVQKVLPAYFRSQRQIIIDTEALIAARPTLAASAFEETSDTLGVDQKVLRLRYGQFLGEGFESAAERAPAEAAAATGADAPAESLKQIPGEAEAPEASRNGLGQAEDVLHEFGHAHDIDEAATLLDPETRRLLKRALDEMWQAELNLRQAKPVDALPYEYKALDYIKQVQQAERIYLQRAGLELPQADLSRRLTGERKDLSDRSIVLPTAAADGSPVPAIVAALDAGTRPDLSTLSAWLAAHPDATPDALGVLAAADQVQREPDCGRCRADLKARLWPLLPVPPTALKARRTPDAAGSAWLDAIGSVPR